MSKGVKRKARPLPEGADRDLKRSRRPSRASWRPRSGAGLLKDKSSRIAGRVSPALIEQAKRRTGIESDTDLIEFALANIALEDNFAEVFKASHGKVDPDLKLGF